jgi:large subunit ribosomal protein L4
MQRCVRWQLAKRRPARTHQEPRRDRPHRQEDLQAEGHRRRPSRFGRARSSAAVAGLRSGRSQPCARSAQEGARAGAASCAVGEGQSDGGSSSSTRRSGSPSPRPRRCASFGKLGLANALIIDGAESRRTSQLAARNIPNIDVLPVQGINVYDILRREKLVLTKAAVDALEARFK